VKPQRNGKKYMASEYLSLLGYYLEDENPTMLRNVVKYSPNVTASCRMDEAACRFEG
jgi:hypothetical protein